MPASRFSFTKILALALGLSLVAASCGSATVESSDVGSSNSVEVEVSAGSDTELETDSDSDLDGSDSPDGTEVAGDPRLAGEFATIDQATFDLASVRGQDTVLWFWAPW